jgi:hypothetical protein
MIAMSSEQQCKACGVQTFVKGKMSGYANVTPVNKVFGSPPLLLTFCKECGKSALWKLRTLKNSDDKVDILFNFLPAK